MPTVQSKFAVNASLINDFMMNESYSMFVKSWTLFKCLCIDHKALQETMFLQRFKTLERKKHYVSAMGIS